MRTKTKIGLAAAIGGVATLLSPAAAFAASSDIGYGYGGINNGGYHVYACDTKADNWGVRVHYKYKNSSGKEVTATVGDANGSSSGCGIKDLPSGVPAYKYNVCAGVSGADSACSGWKSA